MSIRWRELCTKTLKNLCHKELSLQHGEVLTNTSPRSRAKRAGPEISGVLGHTRPVLPKGQGHGAPRENFSSFTFGIKRAQELAKEKAELALKNLSCLPRSGFRSALEDMVMFNLERIN
ncbi:hypothetical protein F2Q69_00026922 [Brassica cretica]|uniref:Uncharacterized protein n=1 Tax=Brassica cretica TaxID=69181 RepID=A0A8S9S933_BRACR|nr:hypothetical protein F2Q69_00026922 [Brassica cretica]